MNSTLLVVGVILTPVVQREFCKGNVKTAAEGGLGGSFLQAVKSRLMNISKTILIASTLYMFLL
jgi:hypothetical protein